MKKIYYLLFFFGLSLISLSGCSNSSDKFTTKLASEITTSNEVIYESMNVEADMYGILSFYADRTFKVQMWKMNGATDSDDFTSLIVLTGTWEASTDHSVKGIYDANDVEINWTFSDDYSTVTNDKGAEFKRFRKK